MASAAEFSTYDQSWSTNIERNQIRAAIGDTGLNGPPMVLSDDIIDTILVSQPVLGLAAAACCNLIVAHYAPQVNTRNSRISVDASSRMEHYRTLSRDLAKKGGSLFDGKTHVPALARIGGTSQAAKTLIDEDTDDVTPFFRRDDNDNPRTGRAADRYGEDC